MTVELTGNFVASTINRRLGVCADSRTVTYGTL